MSKRPRAADLVKGTTGDSFTRNVNWYHRLNKVDQAYVNEVVNELIFNPNAALYLVSDKLGAELNIDRHSHTIARTLKEMVKHGQAKREKADK